MLCVTESYCSGKRCKIFAHIVWCLCARVCVFEGPHSVFDKLVGKYCILFWCITPNLYTFFPMKITHIFPRNKQLSKSSLSVKISFWILYSRIKTLQCSSNTWHIHRLMCDYANDEIRSAFRVLVFELFGDSSFTRICMTKAVVCFFQILFSSDTIFVLLARKSSSFTQKSCKHCRLSFMNLPRFLHGCGVLHDPFFASLCL